MSYSYFAGVVIVCCCREGGENVVKKQTSGNLALEQRRVIVIPAHDEIIARKLRVAAYARVSSSSEDQLNSYRVQKTNTVSDRKGEMDSCRGRPSSL